MQTDDSTHYCDNETQWRQCQAYILKRLQIRKKHLAVRGPLPPGPAITISHQTGSGAHEIAARLAGLLQAGEPEGAAQWTVFDRHLVEMVLAEHHLPRSLAKFMPEDRRSYIQDVMDELVGLRPPSGVIVPQIAETVLHLADAGYVILVGRGADFITARMPNVFHVRLIASLPKRIARVQKLNRLTPAEATKIVQKEDRARGRYVKAHFHACVDDDLLYDLVINTGRILCPAAARLIAEAARGWFQNGTSDKK